MILDFKYSKITDEATWRYKGATYKISVPDAKLIRNYEFLEKIFVIKIEDNTSVLYVYDAEGNQYDKIISSKDFFVAGIRGGILQPEFLIKRKGYKPAIFIYETKKKRFIETGEEIKTNKNNKKVRE